jgi:tRNA-Thr(GGU) m(6)t(6)A37 methyltransferase TsaA
MTIELRPIGFVRTEKRSAGIPRHWSFSEVEGKLEISKQYQKGLKDIRPGQQIVVLFHFHRSPAFGAHFLVQTPPHRSEPLGVFSICSPNRPNPIGLSVVEVLEVEENILWVKGLDMYDGTPILDIKPHIGVRCDCPSDTNFNA